MKQAAKFKHSVYADFLKIYKCIYYHNSIEKACAITGRNRSSLFRTLHKYVQIIKGQRFNGNGKYRHCANLANCIRTNGFTSCPSDCPNFKQYICPLLKKWPYVCNQCPKLNVCKKEKHIFDPEYALGILRNNEKESKHFPEISSAKLKSFDEFITPLIMSGCSIEAIYEVYPDRFPASVRTVRNWINNGYLTAKRSNLINTLSRPFVSKEYKYTPSTTRNPLMKAGRTYEDYLAFQSLHPDFNVTQFDTVHGKKRDKQSILTIYDVESKIQLGILLKHFTATEVREKIEDIKCEIGDLLFSKIFKIMVADNGPEFDELYLLENDEETGEKLVNVFFTRPYRSGDKGACERNHEFFRYIMAKGITMDFLTQEDLNLYFSMINSYPRKSLGGKTPIDVLDEIYGKDFHKKLGQRKMELKDINFKILRK